MQEQIAELIFGAVTCLSLTVVLVGALVWLARRGD